MNVFTLKFVRKFSWKFVRKFVSKYTVSGFLVLTSFCSVFVLRVEAGHPFISDNQTQNAIAYLEWYNQMQFQQAMNTSLAISWRGTKPLGFSYMPPIGADAIFNSHYYSQMQPYIWGPYFQTNQMLQAR